MTGRILDDSVAMPSAEEITYPVDTLPDAFTGVVVSVVTLVMSLLVVTEVRSTSVLDLLPGVCFSPSVDNNVNASVEVLSATGVVSVAFPLVAVVPILTDDI